MQGEHQHTDVDGKIVAALERLSQVLRLLLWEQGKACQLSPIQIQFLIYLASHPLRLCRVSQLAREFGLTPATVSDAISTLERKQLLSRQPWPEDGRISSLCLTDTGKQLADQLAPWAQALKNHLASFPLSQRLEVMQFLMRLIESLQKAGIISLSRMCFTCRFFQPDTYPDPAAPHHCRLMDKPLTLTELRFDCPDHENTPEGKEA